MLGRQRLSGSKLARGDVCRRWGVVDDAGQCRGATTRVDVQREGASGDDILTIVGAVCDAGILALVEGVVEWAVVEDVGS